VAQLTFYPIGNADSTLIELNDGRIILKDYCNRQNCDDGRVILDQELKGKLEALERNTLDYVIFSHADDDHVHGSDEFFYLQHASKYQSSDRIHIGELWVPACFILETGTSGSARAIRQEARYRFKLGRGIRVFGNPDALKQWLRDYGTNPSNHDHLIVRAGQCLPDFSQSNGAVEIFPHSPFSFRMEDGNVKRNDNSIVLHLTFFEAQQKLRCLLGADAVWETWSDIVYITRHYGNDERLEWDLFRISHHCSHTALGPTKGNEETVPVKNVEYLFQQGNNGCRIISSSKPIPNEDTAQPPHRQTAAFYRRIAHQNGHQDNFLVTMEWPDATAPRPIVAKTSVYGFRIEQGLTQISGTSSVIGSASPRFGTNDV